MTHCLNNMAHFKTHVHAHTLTREDLLMGSGPTGPRPGATYSPAAPVAPTGSCVQTPPGLRGPEESQGHQPWRSCPLDWLFFMIEESSSAHRILNNPCNSPHSFLQNAERVNRLPTVQGGNDVWLLRAATSLHYWTVMSLVGETCRL